MPSKKSSLAVSYNSRRWVTAPASGYWPSRAVRAGATSCRLVSVTTCVAINPLCWQEVRAPRSCPGGRGDRLERRPGLDLVLDQTEALLKSVQGPGPQSEALQEAPLAGTLFEWPPGLDQTTPQPTNHMQQLAFRAQRHGRIVIVSSEAAFFGQPANSMYCASKWAIEGWAKFVAYELEPFGIDVILMEPGPYRTSIWHSSPRIKPPDSAYFAWIGQAFQAGDWHGARMARDPKEVGVAIARVLGARRPGFRYPVGPFAHLNHFLRGKMPIRRMQRGVQRYLGLPRFSKWRRTLPKIGARRED